MQLKKGQPCIEQVGETLDKIAYALRLFEVEICCLLKDWDRVQAIVAVRLGPTCGMQSYDSLFTGYVQRPTVNI